jgi:hypothetical protein
MRHDCISVEHDHHKKSSSVIGACDCILRSSLHTHVIHPQHPHTHSHAALGWTSGTES